MFADGDDDDETIQSQIDKKLLIILVDGLRPDYIERDKALKGFPRLAKNGVHAKVDPIHPASSFPNHFSIVTGLYAESHGFIDNYIRDKSSGDLFLLGRLTGNTSIASWYSQNEPLWVTAEKHKVKSALNRWTRCETSDNPRKRPTPHLCEPHVFLTAKEERIRMRVDIERTLQDFVEHKYRLAMIYYKLVDEAGHKYGPQSRVTKQAVRDIDEMIYDLQDLIIKLDLSDDVNLYVLSDHGMLSTKGFTPIELDDIVDMNDVELVLGDGAIVQLMAERGKHNKVRETNVHCNPLLKCILPKIYKKLRGANIRGLNVYEKANIPARFHIKNHKNLLPIYLTADKGYYIVTVMVRGGLHDCLIFPSI